MWISRIWCLLQWQQNRSKATMWNLCEFWLLGGAQDVFSRLTTVCWMLLHHNPYRLPQHYKRHVCIPSCSCKHRFFWISLEFWVLVLSELYGYSTPLTTFMVKKECLFHRPVSIFQHTANSRASGNKSTQCVPRASQLEEMHSYCLLL
jgi:hypothetical protein